MKDGQTVTIRPIRPEDEPLMVKFHETGFQNIRVYVGQQWVRIDAIWLSATQKTRPSALYNWMQATTLNTAPK